MQKQSHRRNFSGLVVMLACLAGFVSVARAQNVQFIQTSDPAGIVNQASFPALDSVTNTVTAPLLAGGYAFCYWTINGVRYNDLIGVALNPVTFTANAPIAAVANYLPTTQDSNGSGLPDAFKLEYFGTLDITSNSIPNGDGFTVGQKLNYGWNPATFNVIETGGISRRRGSFLVVVPGYVGPRDKLGGISRRRSATTTVILNNAYARLNVVSDPSGILGRSQVVLKGSAVNLPIAPTSSYGYNFTGWLTNGVRVDQPTQNQPIPIIINQDTTVVARYISATADTLGVGIPDWMELFYFNQIGYGLDDDPVGDGIPLGVKIFRGYSLAVAHELDTGGISRRRSAITTVILNTNYVQLVAVSDPADIVSSSQVVLKGSTVNLPVAPTSSYGYSFTGWLTNGVRVDQPTQNQPIPITVNEGTTAVARYISATADTLGVGIPDWIELFNFNQLGYTTNSDPIGDGFTLGMKLFRGYPLDVFNELDLGGISRRRGITLPVNFFPVPPPGAVTGTATPIGTFSATFNGSVNPNSLPTSGYFEYGLSNQYGNSSTMEIVGSGTNSVFFSQTISGLAPASTYHFRIVSSSKSGTSYGGDQTFTTMAEPYPVTLSSLTITNGVFQFAFTNIPGAAFSVFGTTNLSVPFSNWVFLGILTDSPPGQYQYTDAQATNYPQRFYRVTSP